MGPEKIVGPGKKFGSRNERKNIGGRVGCGGYVVGWLRRLCGGLVAEAMWWVGCGCGGYVVG